MALPYVSAKDTMTDDPTLLVRQRVYNPSTGAFELSAGRLVRKDEFFKNRAIIVGATAMALYDLRNTPLEKNYPGPETHLTVLANLMEGKLIRNLRNEQALLPVIALVGGAFFSTAVCALSPLWGFIVFILALFFTLGVDFYLFVEKGILGSHFIILNELIFIYLSVTVYKYFTEERARRELRSTFSKYVSPAIVDEVLKDSENLKLGGRKQRMTVMFSDVRGFTTISEKLPPTELAQLLNDYLSPMTDIVFKNKGTLDKYMGDAIMAFFGAPIFDKDHAIHACRCALESLEKLKELQAQFKERNLPRIDIGIGINTGEMSVGNMGSKIVQSYTVMGDSVNLGSRLEGINKEYGTRIIISEFTHAEVKNRFSCREVDRVRVKGKNEPVRIFEVLKEGPLGDQEKSWMNQYEAGLQLYHNKQFQDALVFFQKSDELRKPDPLSQIYVERCESYIQDPPPSEWDGVYVMKTK
jgi:adenylate cyclase